MQVGDGTWNQGWDARPQQSHHASQYYVTERPVCLVVSAENLEPDCVILILIMSLISCVDLGNLFNLSLDYYEDEIGSYM